MPEFNEGQKLAGCYVLRRRVEAAGEVIWLALDEVLGKDVSLHFLPAAVRADSRAMNELRQEIKKHRQLIHPNILRVYDFIEENEWAAISMDSFDGESLAAKLRARNGGVFEPSEIKPWVPQLCQTLEDAHRIQTGAPRAFSRKHLPERRRQTASRQFWHQPGPQRSAGAERRHRREGARSRGDEPAAARRRRPSPSDDVYALGILLHELLTGEHPFGAGDLVPQIRKTTPGTLSARRSELKKGSEALPGSWDKTVASCLEKTPEARPKSMTEVVSRLGGDKGSVEAVVIRLHLQLRPSLRLRHRASPFHQ
jgi:serine/threonine protein kinase